MDCGVVTIFFILIRECLYYFIVFNWNVSVGVFNIKSNILLYFGLLKGRWCDIIVLNVHAPTEDKDDDIKDSFYEEIEQLFDQLPKYHMKILLGDFNAKVGQ